MEQSQRLCSGIAQSRRPDAARTDTLLTTLLAFDEVPDEVRDEVEARNVQTAGADSRRRLRGFGPLVPKTQKAVAADVSPRKPIWAARNRGIGL